MQGGQAVALHVEGGLRPCVFGEFHAIQEVAVNLTKITVFCRPPGFDGRLRVAGFLRRSDGGAAAIAAAFRRAEAVAGKGFLCSHCMFRFFRVRVGEHRVSGK